MKQIKTRHKLIPAIIMLLVAAITMSTASYAWFTMSTKVEVTGIQLNVVAPANILIRKAGTTDNFTNKLEITVNPTGTLNHASSANGANLYTLTAAASANVPEAGTLPTNLADGHIVSAPNKVDGATSGYWVDYQLELVNTGGAAEDVGLQNVDITGANAGVQKDTNIAKAARFAILNAAGDTNIESVGNPIFASRNITLDVLSGTNVTGNSYKTSKAAVNTHHTSKLFTLAAQGNSDPISPSGTTTVTLRIWIEGQDTDYCKTVNAGSAFKVKFEFNIIP